MSQSSQGTSSRNTCVGHAIHNNFENDPNHPSKQNIYTADSDNSPYFLNIYVPDGKQQTMRRILRPFFKHLEYSCNFVKIRSKCSRNLEKVNQIFPLDGSQNQINNFHNDSSHSIIRSPALAVTVLLPANHVHCDINKMRAKFKKSHWKHHHSIQLHHKSLPNITLGKQEYYFMSRNYPLWSVSDSPSENESRFRITIFVREFARMVEFYRLLTGTEMESTKPDFCLFNLDKELFTNKDSSNFSSSLKSSHSTQTSSSSSSSSTASFSPTSSNLSGSTSSSTSSSLSSFPETSPISSILSFSPESPYFSQSQHKISNTVHNSKLPTKLELVLKHNPSIDPFPLDDALIKLPVEDIMPFYTLLENPIHSINCFDYLVEDPDGNKVILHDLSTQSRTHSYQQLSDNNLTYPSSLNTRGRNVHNCPRRKAELISPKMDNAHSSSRSKTSHASDTGDVWYPASTDSGICYPSPNSSVSLNTLTQQSVGIKNINYNTQANQNFQNFHHFSRDKNCAKVASSVCHSKSTCKMYDKCSKENEVVEFDTSVIKDDISRKFCSCMELTHKEITDNCEMIISEMETSLKMHAEGSYRKCRNSDRYTVGRKLEKIDDAATDSFDSGRFSDFEISSV